jgi:hypothetical protein
MDQDYSVPGSIQPVKQPNLTTCWAAVATMLKSWKERRCYTIEEALRTAKSGTYLEMFNRKMGLRPEFTAGFADSMGFRVAPQNPDSLSVQSWVELMLHRGPLGVMSFYENGAHARLMFGMWGDEPAVQVRFIDPLSGLEDRIAYKDFLDSIRRAPADTAQIWHW